MTKLPINFRSRASKCPIYGLLPISTPLFRPLPIHIMGTAGPGCKDWPVPDARPRPDPCPTAGPAPTPRAQTRVGPARQGRGAVTAPDQRRRAPPRIRRPGAPFPRSHASPRPSAPPPASPPRTAPPRSPAPTPPARPFLQPDFAFPPICPCTFPRLVVFWLYASTLLRTAGGGALPGRSTRGR